MWAAGAASDGLENDPVDAQQAPHGSVESRRAGAVGQQREAVEEAPERVGLRHWLGSTQSGW